MPSEADTAVLHGAMDRFERAAAVSRFNGGGARVLLATDAAGEGLNLQHRCRLVVNLELPWNPMRLEQRIGRVDRIGQSRTVHVDQPAGIRNGRVGPPRAPRRAARRREAHCRRNRGRAGRSRRMVDDRIPGTARGALGARRPGQVRSGGRPVPPAVQRLDLGSAAREVGRGPRASAAAASSLGGREAHAAERGSRLGVPAGILVTAVRRSRLSIARGRSGLLVIFRVRSAAHADLRPATNWCPCSPTARARGFPPSGRPRPCIGRDGDSCAADGLGHPTARRAGRTGR